MHLGLKRKRKGRRRKLDYSALQLFRLEIEMGHQPDVPHQPNTKHL